MQSVSVCSFEDFLKDQNSQDIILFNLQLAIQNCIDMAAHIVSDENMGIPGSTSEMFYLLEESGYLDHLLTEKMVKAIGLRNLIVHEYGRLDLKRIYDISQKDPHDLELFIQTILKKI